MTLGSFLAVRFRIRQGKLLPIAMADLRIVVVGAGRVSRELAPAWHGWPRHLARGEPDRPIGTAFGRSVGLLLEHHLDRSRRRLSDAEVVVVAVTDGLISESAPPSQTWCPPLLDGARLGGHAFGSFARAECSRLAHPQLQPQSSSVPCQHPHRPRGLGRQRDGACPHARFCVERRRV